MVDRVIRVVIDSSGAERGGKRVENSLGRIDRASGGARSSLGLLKTALVAVAGSLAVRQAIRYADAYTTIGNRLRLVTDSAEELTTVQNELLESANRTRTSYESTVELYARVARSSDQLGLSQRELLDFTEGVNQAIQVSGATAQEASAGVIQFAQGLASGRLSGDELRSVLEQMPRLATAIAEGLGVTVGELRKLGEEGALNGRAVINAIQSQLPQLAEEFEKVQVTTGQALTQVQNSLIDVVGRIDDATGFSDSFASSMSDLSDDLLTFGRAVTGGLEPTDKLGENMQFITATTVTLASALNVIGDVISIALIEPLKAAGETIGATAAAFAAAARGDISGAFAIFKARGESFVDQYDEISDKLGETVDETATSFQTIAQIYDESARTAETALKELEENTKKALAPERDPEVVEDIQEIIEALKQESETVGFTAAEVKLYELALLGATEAELAQAEALVEKIELLEDEADAQKKATEELEKNKEADLEVIENLRNKIELIQLSEKAQARKTAVDELSVDATEEQKRVVGELAEELYELEAANEAAAKRTAELEEFGRDLAATMSSAFEEAILNGEGFDNVLKSLLDDIAKLIIRFTVLEPLTRQLAGFFSDGGFNFGSLFGGGGGGGFDFGSILGSFFGGGKQLGGAVVPGGAYIVGESGPELFTPSNAGNITPNKQSGGDVRVSNTFNINAPGGNVPRETIAQIQAKAGSSVQRALKRNR